MKCGGLRGVWMELQPPVTHIPYAREERVCVNEPRYSVQTPRNPPHFWTGKYTKTSDDMKVRVAQTLALADSDGLVTDFDGLNPYNLCSLSRVRSARGAARTWEFVGECDSDWEFVDECAPAGRLQSGSAISNPLNSRAKNARE